MLVHVQVKMKSFVTGADANSGLSNIQLEVVSIDSQKEQG